MPITIGQMMMMERGFRSKREIEKIEREREASSEKVMWEKVRNERNIRDGRLIEILMLMDDLLR